MHRVETLLKKVDTVETTLQFLDLALFMINLASKKCQVWIFKNRVFICFNPSTKILWPPAQNMVWAFKIVLHSTFFILQVFLRYYPKQFGVKAV